MCRFNTCEETYPSPDACPPRQLTKFQLINLIWSQFNSPWPKISAYCSKTCNHLTVYCNCCLSGLVLLIRVHSDENKEDCQNPLWKIKKAILHTTFRNGFQRMRAEAALWMGCHNQILRNRWEMSVLFLIYYHFIYDFQLMQIHKAMPKRY